jgi:hypothetical protein
MKRENLDFLEAEQIDKVMALYGKAMAKKDSEIDTLKSEKKGLEDRVETYETKIKEFDEKAKDNAEWKTKYEELQTSISEQEAKQKAKEEDDILTKNITSVFGDKKFVNDFTKNAIMNEIKIALKDSANMGKSAKDLFEEITNGKDGIFENPNKVVDMPSVDETVENVVSKADFDKMGYKERLELKASNPELFNKYNN